MSPAHEEATSAISHDAHTPTTSYCGRNPGMMPPLAPSKQKFGISPATRASQQVFAVRRANVFTNKSRLTPRGTFLL